jgi:hypothetical protein
MNAACVRCNRPAFAILEIAASIGATRLEVGGEAEPPGIGAPCLVELTIFFGAGKRDPVPEENKLR